MTCETTPVIPRRVWWLFGGRVGAQWELQIYNYAHFRPHEALGGATPAEINFGRTPSHLSAIPPPRGRPGEGPLDLPFRVAYLDAERLLPVLVQQPA